MKKIILSLALTGALLLNFGNASAQNVEKSKTAVNQVTPLAVTRMQGPKLDSQWSDGLRGTFGGVLGNQLIVAGGNCFPGNSYGNKVEKKYSKDIYSAVINGKSKRLSWKKIGELPEELANGATVVTKDAMYLVGGENRTGAKASITKLNFKDGLLQVDTIAYMPVLAKDCGAAIIDDKLHIIGGLQNGKPSNAHLLLDLKQLKQGWKFLQACPEAPRQQPVVVSQKDESGREQLYVWGGFGPGQEKNNLELSCEGYKYDPVKKSWKLLPSPLDKELARVYLGSGKLLPVGERYIAAVGGAGYKVLRQSLLQKPQDYYNHEPSWYGYNNKLYIYDTITNKWECRGEAMDIAVALNGGAVSGNQLYVIEGELKPGVATSGIIRINL